MTVRELAEFPENRWFTLIEDGKVVGLRPGLRGRGQWVQVYPTFTHGGGKNTSDPAKAEWFPTSAKRLSVTKTGTFKQQKP